MKKSNFTDYFAERRAKADVGKALEVLTRAGVGNEPLPGDALRDTRRRLSEPSIVRESPLDEQLRFAIAHKKLIEVKYNGRLRVVEPHDYGIKNGSAKLLVYQLREASPGYRGRDKGWKLFEVSKIQGCAVLDTTFAGSRGESEQRHHAWDEVFARVG